MVDLVHRWTHKPVFRLGEMPFRQSAQLQTGNTKAERTNLMLQRGRNLMQIALIIQQYITGTDWVAVSARDVLTRTLIDIQHLRKALVPMNSACDSRCRYDLLGGVQQTRHLTGYKTYFFRHALSPCANIGIV